MLIHLQLTVGDNGEPWNAHANTDAELDCLSEEARERCLCDAGIALPSELALLLLELSEDDGDRFDHLRSMLPAWLSPDDREVLTELLLDFAIPARSSLILNLRVHGRAGDAGYRASTQWMENGLPLRSEAHVHGPTIVIGDRPARRLTLGQRRVLDEVRRLNSTAGEDRNIDLENTARLTAAIPTGDGGVDLDPFLQREEVVAVEKIAPRLVQISESEFQVRPHAENVEDSALQDYYYRTPRSELGRGRLTTRTGKGGRKRVVFAPRAAKGLEDCRDINTLNAEQAAHALTAPDEVFGESIDTSGWSERVEGIGLPVRVVVPSLRENKVGDWWDWDLIAELEPVSTPPDDSNTTHREHRPTVSLKDAGSRERLRAALEEADRSGDLFIPNPFGSGFLEVTQGLRQAVESADALAAESDRATGRLARPARMVLRIKDNLETLRFDRATPPLLEKYREVDQPEGLLNPFALKPHQLEGFQWLKALYSHAAADKTHWSGALLADDMGLGKTIQVLALMASLTREGGGPHLLVAPVALLENWKREAKQFFGDLLEPTVIITSSELRRARTTGQSASNLERQHLVLVSYETLRIHEATFARVPWDMVILDEAQKAKNPTSQIARVIRTLKARFRLALSGTPVENTLRELWALYDWTLPGLLGSLREFSDRFVKPLQASDNATRTRLSRELQRIIGPFFTRRMKSTELADCLPSIDHHAHEIPLSAEQENRYSSIMAEKLADSAPAMGKLIRLFGATAHPQLEPGRIPLPPGASTSFPKFVRLCEILERVRERGEKVIVFANRCALQRWLADQFEQRWNVAVPIVNGEINDSRQRYRLIEEFSEHAGFGVIVLSPRAAGVGLNITSANHVVHYTREWNPAVENQATDRVYRIGQTRPVNVHTLTATSPRGITVDQSLAQLLEEKRALMRDFVVPMGGFDISPGEMLARSEQ